MATGAEWSIFNVAQNKVRKDMVCIYGNTKQLIPLSMGFHLGETGRDIRLIILLQVLVFVMYG